MQNYEIALIINPDLSKDIDKFFTSFEKLLSDNNFSISRLEDVGRRKLAYSIDDHNKGHYLRNPIYATSIGLLAYGNDRIKNGLVSNSGDSFVSKAWSWLKNNY